MGKLTANISAQRSLSLNQGYLSVTASCLIVRNPISTGLQHARVTAQRLESHGELQLPLALSSAKPADVSVSMKRTISPVEQLVTKLCGLSTAVCRNLLSSTSKFG